MLLLVSLFFFAIIHNVKILDEHMSFNYQPLRPFAMIRLWVELWHWTPCYQQDGFDLIKFGSVTMHVSSNQSGCLINIFLESLFELSTGHLMVCIYLRYNIKLQPTWIPPPSYFCAYLFVPKWLHLIEFFSVIGFNPWNFPKYFIASRIRFYIYTLHWNRTSPCRDRQL